MIVYEITHSASGMRYIGSTIGPLQKRWVGHCGPALRVPYSLSPLQEAIRRFGPEAFTARVIASARTVEDLRTTEAAIIAQEGTKWPNGFNVDGLKGYRNTLFGRRHDARRRQKGHLLVSSPGRWRQRRSHPPLKILDLT